MTRITSIIIAIIVAIVIVAPVMVYAHDPTIDEVTIFVNYDEFHYGDTLNIFVDTNDLVGNMTISIIDPKNNLVSSTQHTLSNFQYESNNAFVTFDLVDPNAYFRGDYQIIAEMDDDPSLRDETSIYLNSSYWMTFTEPSGLSYNSTTYILTNGNGQVPSSRTMYVSHIDSVNATIRDHNWTMAGAGGITFSFNPLFKNIATGNVTFSVVDQLTGLVAAEHIYYYAP